MEEPSALAAVFLPGDLRPVLPSPQTRKSREALPDVRSVATAAAEAARSFDWSLLQGASLLEGASCPTNSEEVEIAGVGLCVSAREPCALLSRHALPPHLPTFVSAQSACLYTPKTGDVVVGLITSKGREFYDVNIRSCADARLAAVGGFEGATRRNKPTLAVGGIVLCRVERVAHLLGAEVTCCSPKCTKSWASEEKVLGELKGGLVLDLPIPFALSLMLPEAALPRLVGAKVPYEFAVGFNGRVWIKANDAATSLRIANCFKAAVGAQSSALLQRVVELILTR